MRLHLSTIFIASFLVMGCTDYGQLGCDGHCSQAVPAGEPGSCPVTGHQPGTVEGQCRGWPDAPCDSNARCIDGTCIACGGDGQVCCVSGTSQVCSGGAFCSATSGDWDTCTSSCGGPGLSCCNSEIPCGQGVCDVDSHTCIDPASACVAGNVEYMVWLYDASGCAQQQLFFKSDNDTDATACATAAASRFGWQAGTLNQDAVHYHLCGQSFQGDHPLEIDVQASSDLSACEHESCLNCTMWTDQDAAGNCP